MVIRSLALNLLIIFLFSALLQPGYAQRTGNIKGTVADSTNGEVLPFCSISIPELKRGATTDTKGVFLFTGIPEGKTYTLIASYVGYKTRQVSFKVEAYEMSEVRIKLSPSAVKLNTVEVQGEMVKTETPVALSLEKITAAQLNALPKNVETDVLRSLQYFPGVQFGGDASARFYVRGGGSNQNLILLNDAPIYNPFHALGIFSAIDPDMINSMEFYKGAYPAEFNGRLSSVLNIVTKDGNRNKFSGKASLSFLTGRALIEGPIPNGSFIITGRKSTSNEILKKFLNDENYPVNFWDASFKLNFSNPKIMKDAKFTIQGFFTEDNLKYNDPSRQDYRWVNTILGFNYFQLSDSPLFYNISFNFSKYRGDVTPNESYVKASTNIIEDITCKIDFKYMYQSKDELDLGFKVQDINTTLLMINYYGFETDLGKWGVDISVYGKYMLLSNDFFNADIGTRISLTRMAGDKSGFLEPRVRLTFNLSPTESIRGAWGIFKQDLTTISDENEAITLYEPWIIVPLYLFPSSAIHYVLGFESRSIRNFIFDFDAYYKICHNLVFANELKILGKDKDLVQGKSKSYGLEFQMKTNQKYFSLIASYSLAWAFNDVNGNIYSPRYDSRHNVNLNFDCDLGSGWKFSLSWVYNSGHPFTQINGYYDKLSADDSFFGSLVTQKMLPYALPADRNAAFLPDYHRLDVTLSKQLDLSFMKILLDISVINAYNRKNIFYFDKTTGEQVNMLPIIPAANIKVEF